jgi:hypothetical protein
MELPRLRPTTEQYDAFREHICNAHSWYKHLPLMHGRRFVVFVAPDAGIGRLVARPHGGPEKATGHSLVAPPEGPEFTEEHPRLHYSWQTTKEYRGRFGYLDYMSRSSPDEGYGRDAGQPVSLPKQVEERCGFVLYPYVSCQFAESITWGVHAETLRILRVGAAHPFREQVLELARLIEARQSSWSALSDPERHWIADSEIEKVPRKEPSTQVRKYLELEDAARTISCFLREREVDKISHALAELDKLLLQET